MARGGHAGGGRLFGVAADVGEHLNGQFGVRLGQRFHQPFRRQGPRALGHLFRHHRVVRAARDGRQSFATAPPTANRGWRAAVRTARGARAPQDHPRNGFSAYDTVRGGGQRVSWGGGRFSAGFGAGAGSGPPGRARTLGPPPGAAAATERGTLSRCFSSVSEPLTQQQGQFPAERATRLATTKALRYPLQRWTDWAAIATAQRLVASTQGFSAGFVCFQRDTTLLNRTEVRKRFRFHYARVFLDVL